MKSEKRIKKLIDKLKKNEYKEIGRVTEKSFIRKRSMSFGDLALGIMIRKGKTLDLELDEYMGKRKKKTVTKQAFSSQRQNLKPELFQRLNEDYIAKIY